MSVKINGTEIESMFHNGVEVQTWLHNGVEVYSAGKMVTYIVDTEKSYQEKVKKGQTCLNPTSFTPAKSGWTFVGWREDKTASGDVLQSKVMGNAPITLYAVFKQTITCTFKSNNSTQYASGTRYYNNGNVINASVTVPTGASMSGWTWRGWGNSTGAKDSVYASNGSTLSGLTADITLYGLYQRTCTLYYNGNGNTGGSMGTTSGTAYYNISGNQVNPTVTIAGCGFSKTAYSFNGWSINGGTYNAGGTVTLSSTSVTAYAIWTASNGVQVWSGTIEPYGTSELTMPINCGTYDLTGFKYLRPWLKMKNPNVSGTVEFMVYNSSGTELTSKKYKDLQFANSTTLDSLALIDVSGCSGNCTVKVTRSGHDGKTEITGAVYLYTVAPY